MANRTKSEIEDELAEISIAMRALLDDVKDESKAFKADEVKARQAELQAKRDALNKELAELQTPKATIITDERAGTIYDPEVWKKAAMDKRAITLGGTSTSLGIGSINQLSTLFKEVSDNDDILNKAMFFYGRDATTSIPVLAPIDDPADYAEGTKATEDEDGVTSGGIAEDTGGSIYTTDIQPKAYATILPITYETQAMGSVNFESQINDVFQKAFRKKMHKGMISGAGTNKTMKGIWTSAKSGTGVTGTALGAAGTAIKISELAKLALSVLGKSEPYTILMNPAIYQTLLGDTSTGEDVKLYKESLIRDKSIEGVPIILDSQITTGTTQGDPVVVAAPLGRYAIGIAQQVVIKAVEDKNSTYTYFKAVMFFSGRQISETDIHLLKVK